MSAPVLVAGAVVALAGTAVGLRRLRAEEVPRAGMMAAAFFVGSAVIRVPTGLLSAHLLLNGLAGLILGWAVFPALLVGLFFQAVLLGFGGLTTLGVNTTAMALPGVIVSLMFGRWLRRSASLSAGGAFAAGVLGVLLAAVLCAGALFFSGKAFLKTAAAVVVVHLPIMPVEGLLCLFCVGFLRRVKPELLPLPGKREVADDQ